MQQEMSPRGVTTYGGVTDIYFKKVLKSSIKILGVAKKELKILDFGCGHRQLSKSFPDYNIVGFDKIGELTQIEDWRSIRFEVVIANHVFCQLPRDELRNLVISFVEHGVSWLVVSESNQGVLNRIGMKLMRRQDAHSATVQSQLEVFQTVREFGKELRQLSTFNLSRTMLFQLDPDSVKR